MTAEALNITDFLAKSKEDLIIDVRSPIEFCKGHIYNAVNIPLFEDIERAEIGTMYKQQGKEPAI
jgi:tRNA 2-selenouridine synthase